MESNLRKCPYCKKEKDYKQFRLVKSKLPRRGWIDKDKNQRWFQCKICEPLYKAEHYKKLMLLEECFSLLKIDVKKKAKIFENLESTAIAKKDLKFLQN